MDRPPVATPPPVFLNLGIPPANMPPSCGAVGISLADPTPLDAPPASLLLLPLVATLGTGGARPEDFPAPGTAGGIPTGAMPELLDLLSSSGPERSFVTAFFSLAPLVMSVNNAPCMEYVSSSRST